MSVREHDESFSHMNWPPQSPDFTPLKVFGMCLKRLKEYKINTKSLPKMQLWLEINVVTLHNVVETMAQQMCSIIKAKGGPTKYFFGQAVYDLTDLQVEQSYINSVATLLGRPVHQLVNANI